MHLDRARRWSLLLVLASSAASAGETSPPEFEQLMTMLAGAWSRQDTALALECFTPDAVYMQPPDLQRYRGSEELEMLFSGLSPGTFMTFHTLAYDAASGVGFGEFSFGRSGAATADHGVVVVTIRDGRIASWREYFQEGPPSFDESVAVEGKRWKWTAEELQ